MALAEKQASKPAPKPALPVTPRAIIVGALGMALLAIINPQLAYVNGTWTVGEGSLISSSIEMLFILVVLNGLLKRFLPHLALMRAELLVVYGMLIIPTHLLHTGGIPYIVGCTTYPIYMATPSNGWEHSMWPHIPTWLRLNDPQAVRWFWEGIPEGTGLPWGAWFTPAMAWSGFTIALALAMFSLGALLSKDWIERQRLAFPLVDVPLAITGDDERPTLRSSILSNRIFWLGFALPAVVACLDWLHLIYPAVPAVQIYNIEVGRYFADRGLPWSALSGHMGVKVSIIFAVIGITCLLPSEVSLSLWFFYILFRVQQLIWASFGVTEGGGAAGVGIDPQTFMGFQEAGGFIAVSVMVLYQSRGTIRKAWLSLIGREPEDADPYRPLSGRTAVLGFILANAFMFWWASKAGVSWWSFGLWLGIFYTVLIGVSRLVAAAGVMHVDTGVFPRGVILSTVGAFPLGWRSLALLTYLSTIFTYDPRSALMPQMMNSFKLMHTGRVRGRGFSWAAAIALIVTLAVGFVAVLRLIYREGGTSLPTWPFTAYPSWGFWELADSIEAPEMPDNWLRLALVIGALFTALLIWLNTQFVWWPLSPVGFLIASSYETNRSIWVNAFIAWTITTVIRRYGGLRLYRTLYPAFIGLVLGDYLPRGVLAVLSTILGIRQPMG